MWFPEGIPDSLLRACIQCAAKGTTGNYVTITYLKVHLGRMEEFGWGVALSGSPEAREQF